MNDNYGLVNERIAPRIEVLRGYRPETPYEMRTAYPVAFGVTIKSGQVIAPKWNATALTYEWVLPGAGTGHVADFYWAADDSTDEDVQEAGKLPALSCAGQFEFETPYFDADGTYTVGAQLTPDLDNPGDVKVVTPNDGTLPVIGQISRVSPVALQSTVNGVRKSRNSNVKPRVADPDNVGELMVNPRLNVITIRTISIPATVAIA